jgi:hypothetical protein
VKRFICLVLMFGFCFSLLNVGNDIQAAKPGDRKKPPAPDSANPNPFRDPQPVEIIGYNGNAKEPFISRDGRYLFWNTEDSDDPGMHGDLHYAERNDWGVFEYFGEVKGVNTPFVDAVASMDRDGTFYFISTRDYRPFEGQYMTIYRGAFADGTVTDVGRVSGNLDVEFETPGWIFMGAEISFDGNTLFYSKAFFSLVPGATGPQKADIGFAYRVDDDFIVPDNEARILRNINTRQHLEFGPSLSNDLLELFFTRLTILRDGSYGRFLMYRATRPSIDDPFGQPELLDVITEGFVEAASISGDGKTLYYHKHDGQKFSIFKVTRD